MDSIATTLNATILNSLFLYKFAHTYVQTHKSTLVLEQKILILALLDYVTDYLLDPITEYSSISICRCQFAGTLLLQWEIAYLGEKSRSVYKWLGEELYFEIDG